MVVDFSKIDLHERPVLILKNAGDDVIGMLGYAHGVVLDIKYNETSTLEFELPYEVDGMKVPFYDEVIGMRTIEVKGIGCFTTVNPTENNEGTKRYKSCKAYSLEYEFAYKTLTLPEDTYKFYGNNDSVFGMIMSLMPSWRIGHVPASIANKYRTFEVDNVNLYDFIKNTVQESFNCIVDFDTKNRIVNVRDLNDDARIKSVYLSTDNLAKSIEIDEDVESIVTRLDVNGAEDVDIRDVNPTGTNKIINLEHFMNTKNFSQELIDKYHRWVALVEEKKNTYYTYSIQYMLLIQSKGTEEAALVDMNSELAKLENLQAVAANATTMNMPDADKDYKKALQDVKDQQALIDSKKRKIDDIQSQITAKMNEMKSIVNMCRFENYFTEDEYRKLDRYIKDGDISDSSFVVSSLDYYGDTGTGKDITGAKFKFEGGQYSKVSVTKESQKASVIYSIDAGWVTITKGSATLVTSDVVSAVFEIRQSRIGVNDYDIVASMYLVDGFMDGKNFAKATITATGKLLADSSNIDTVIQKLDREFAANSSGTAYQDQTGKIEISTKEGYMYFTFDVSEMQKRSVAMDLYAFGEEQLAKLSQPTFTFKLDSANFLALDDFVLFRDSIEIGEKIYLNIGDSKILKPICTGVKFEYDNIQNLELYFGDTYVSTDGEFRLVDLLGQSISSGKKSEISKYAYASFIDSGASTDIAKFIKSALDISKNKIMSSENQAITWDEAGFRLRKWANNAKTSYEDEQIWMNNNSIIITDDGWDTAKMAIGRIYNEELGEAWGIVAPTIVGKMIAGQNLIIQSLSGQTNDPTGINGTRESKVMEFRVDKDGVRLYNSDIMIAGLGHQIDDGSGNKQWTANHHLVMTQDLGFAMGKYPVISYEEQKDSSGKVISTTRTLNEENANFWVDYDGNVHFKGTLEGANGIFTGKLEVTSSKVSTVIDSQLGIAVYKIEDNGAYSKQLWADSDGNLNMVGRITATNLTIENQGINITTNDFSEMKKMKEEYKTYFTFDNDGFKVGRAEHSYYTLTSDNGFYVMYRNRSASVDELIGEFSSDGLFINRMMTSKAAGNVILRGSQSGGWIWG